eukprot:2756266-Amphidinium_carterae.1
MLALTSNFSSVCAVELMSSCGALLVTRSSWIWLPLTTCYPWSETCRHCLEGGDSAPLAYQQ